MNGIDYAFSPHPSNAAIKAGHYGFVCRYISSFAPNDHNGKNLLRDEAKSLLAAGISIVVVAEEGASDMLGGHDRGVARARHANAVVKALGMPSIPIFFAADWDATLAGNTLDGVELSRSVEVLGEERSGSVLSEFKTTLSQQRSIDAYLDGAASVIGRNRVGIYGGLWPCRRAYEAGKCTWVWQTLAWSGGEWFAHAHLRQVHNGIRVGGASADLNVAMRNDFGQWPRPKNQPPLPTPDPPAPAGRHWIEWKTAGKSSLGDVADATGIPPATILRFTAHHYGTFDRVLYKHINDIACGRKSPETKIPKGAKLWVHRKD